MAKIAKGVLIQRPETGGEIQRRHGDYSRFRKTNDGVVMTADNASS
jgi:hypothetical protein